MGTLTVTAAVVPRLREGAQAQLAEGASTIKAAAEAYTKDEPPLEARARTDRAWALIDVLGWAGDVPESIDVDVSEQGLALGDAINAAVHGLTDVIAELAADDPVRPERMEELQALREFEGAALRAIEREHTEASIIAVPADVAVQLRRALYADLGRAGAELEAACSTTELGDVASPVRSLRRLFAVLDDIGWIKEPPGPRSSHDQPPPPTGPRGHA